MKLKGFLAGLAGGAVAAAAVVLLARVRLRHRRGQQDGRPGTPETPTVYSTPSTTSTGALTPEQIYSNLSGGVVMVLSDFGGAAPTSSARPQSAAGAGHRLRGRQRGLHPHQRARRRRERPEGRAASPWSSTRAAPRPSASPGQLVGVDDGSDVALIKVDPSGVDLKPLPLGDSDKVAVGEPVVAIGNPLGYDFSITSGIVSATGRSAAGAERPDHPQRHPDRRRHQPGQLRRPAHRQRGQGDRHQRADRLAGRRQRRPRLRRADQHRHPRPWTSSRRTARSPTPGWASASRP